ARYLSAAVCTSFACMLRARLESDSFDFTLTLAFTLSLAWALPTLSQTAPWSVYMRFARRKSLVHSWPGLAQKVLSFSVIGCIQRDAVRSTQKTRSGNLPDFGGTI